MFDKKYLTITHEDVVNCIKQAQTMAWVVDLELPVVLRPCLVQKKLQKIFQTPCHIEPCGTCMKY